MENQLVPIDGSFCFICTGPAADVVCGSCFANCRDKHGFTNFMHRECFMLWRVTCGSSTCPTCRRFIVLPPCFIDLTGDESESEDDMDGMVEVDGLDHFHLPIVQPAAEIPVEVTYIDHDVIEVAAGIPNLFERRDNIIIIDHAVVTSWHISAASVLLGH